VCSWSIKRVSLDAVERVFERRDHWPRSLDGALSRSQEETGMLATVYE
jgi:hypothetical protein